MISRIADWMCDPPQVWLGPLILGALAVCCAVASLVLGLA